MGTVSSASPPEPRTVIDAAVHFYDPERPQGVPWPSPDSSILYKRTYPDRYLSAIKPYRVDGVIVIEASPWLKDNLWLLNLADQSPLIRGVVGNIRPGHPDFAAALRRFSKHPLFRGIRTGQGVVAAQRPEIFAGLKQLAGSDLELDLHMSEPAFAQAAELAGKFPDLRIIIGHLPIDGSEEEGLRACAKHRNLFAKVSGVVRRINGRVPADVGFYKPRLDQLWEVFGPERLVFGSNWPTSDLIAPYPVLHKIVLDYFSDKGSDAVERFFWKNSQAVYKWVAA